MVPYLYIMLSSTKTGMGRLIRTVTHFPYNHVSLSADPDLRCWLSFARLNRHAPLVGGLVEETPERFADAGNVMPVVIFRVAIPPMTEPLLHHALLHREELTYNSFSAVASLLHIPCRIKGAYTCLDFANEILQTRYYSIRALYGALQPYLYYKGDFFARVPPEGRGSGVYFDKKAPLTVCWETVLHFAKLICRAVNPSHYRDPIRDFRSCHEV